MAAQIELVSDEILELFRDYWISNAQTVSGLSYTPELLFEQDQREHGDDNLAWARVKIIHNSSSAPTLGGPGFRRFSRYGSLYVNVFARYVDGSGYTVAQRLAQVARDAVEGKSTTNVWFRACRINEKGRDGPWFQINLVADFTWDEVK